MTPIDKYLEQIEARAKAATEGPWRAVHTTYVGFVGESFWSIRGTEPDKEGDRDFIADGRLQVNDAEFIAHSRTDIPRLVEMVRKAYAALEFYAEQKHVRVVGEQDAGLTRTTRIEGAVEIGWRARNARGELDRLAKGTE